MPMIHWEKRESVAVVYMDNGENRQNLEFAQALHSVLDEVEADSTVTAVVLTSKSAKFWSLGVDVEWIGNRMQDQSFDDIKAFMYKMNGVFKKMLLFPAPVIAAINGHAFGNGAILACACDFRFMKADRGYFCLPEVDLGIPFLPGMVEMIKKAIPQHKLNEMKLTGKRADASELEAHHVIEKASPDAEALMEDVLLFAKGFNKKRGIFGEHKKRMHKPILDAMDHEDPAFIEPLFLFVTE
ncbi:MAG: enoyl-CoA hydratase/isomerase family protein [Desulfosalsimonadaceae bacterium]